MKLTIDANIIRAAQANQAKGDYRYYLNGILLAANGDVVATDGHTLFKSNHDWSTLVDSDTPWENTIVNIEGKVPANAATVEFDFDRMVANCVTAKGKVKTFTFTIIDGKFPDYNRVIPSGSSVEPVSVVGFNPALIGRAASFGFACKFTFHGEHGAVVIEPDSSEEFPLGTLMVVMPCRLA
jgi:DNA polymerase III sliding clamp (beta) subunit (PCNA family)